MSESLFLPRRPASPAHPRHHYAARSAITGTSVAPAAAPLPNWVTQFAPPPPPPRDPSQVTADLLRQTAYTGTPASYGLTRPDEYSPDLADPMRRMGVFEEMRNSDDGVNVAIAARELLIQQANWQLTTESDDEQHLRIKEFVEDNLYPLMADLLRWTAGHIQYGFSMLEPVYTWSADPIHRQVGYQKIRRAASKQAGEMLYLRKLAHIRQRTVSSFVTTEQGDLTWVRQHVWTGFRFLQQDVDASKVLLLTYNRQGSDFYGVPPTRSAYKAWTFKQQIEKLNILGIDRFGVGTPVAEAGPDWTDPEYARMQQFLAAWRSGTNSYLIHPSGGHIEIVSGDGRMIMSALEWVKHYNLQIAKTWLTQQTELGGTSHGARALGEIFYEQMEGITQADCEHIAELINEKLVVPLVDMNFGPQDSYPTFRPSQRVRASNALATVIAGLIASKAVTWRPEDEGWIRDVLELPAVDLTTLLALQEERKQEAMNIAAGQIDAATAVDPKGNPTANLAPAATKPANTRAPQQKPPQAGGQPNSATRTLSSRQYTTEAAPAAAAPGTSYRTPEYSAWEARVVRPDLLWRDLDLQTQRTAGELTDVLKRIDDALEVQLASLAAGGAHVLAASVGTIKVGTGLRNQLRRVLADAAARARALGVQAVADELKRGLAAAGAGMRSPDLQLVAQPPDEKVDDQKIQAAVEKATQDEVDRREAAARNAALTALAVVGAVVGRTAAQLAVQLVSAVKEQAQTLLESLSTYRTADAAEGVINAGFGIGRGDGAEKLITAGVQLTSKIYSAVMDGGTCPECAKWDGAEFPIDYPEDRTGVQCPNPRCEGGYGRCRCIFIYVTDEEKAPTVPAAKGVAIWPTPGIAPQAYPIAARRDDDDAETYTRTFVIQPDDVIEEKRHTPQPVHLTLDLPKPPKPKKRRVVFRRNDRGELLGADLVEE